MATLTRTVPDRGNPRWWRPGPASGRRRLVVGAVSLATCVLGALAAGWTDVLPAYLWLAVVVAALTVIDVEHHRLPDRLVGPGYLGGALLLGLAAALGGDGSRLARAGAAAGVVLLGFGVLALAVPSAIGLGDVKLVGLLAGYLGWWSWPHVLVGIFAGFLIGAMSSVLLLLARRATLRTELAFGPALILGALLTAALA